MQSPSSLARVSSFFRNRTTSRRRDIFCVLFFEQFEEVGDKGFFKEVAFEPAVNEKIDDSVRAQKGQVLRHIRLTDIEGLLEVAYALYSLIKFFEDFDSCRMRDNFEEIDSFFYGDHGLGVFLSPMND